MSAYHRSEPVDEGFYSEAFTASTKKLTAPLHIRRPREILDTAYDASSSRWRVDARAWFRVPPRRDPRTDE